jgi:hypothetical protein
MGIEFIFVVVEMFYINECVLFDRVIGLVLVLSLKNKIKNIKDIIKKDGKRY